MKIRTVFQIIFSILAAISFLAAGILGFLKGLVYFFGGVAVTLVFVGLMLFMKYGNPLRREKEEPHTDFMNSEEENEAIRKSLEAAEQEETSNK